MESGFMLRFSISWDLSAIFNLDSENVLYPFNPDLLFISQFSSPAWGWDISRVCICFEGKGCIAMKSTVDSVRRWGLGKNNYEGLSKGTILKSGWMGTCFILLCLKPECHVMILTGNRDFILGTYQGKLTLCRLLVPLVVRTLCVCIHLYICYIYIYTNIRVFSPQHTRKVLTTNGTNTFLGVRGVPAVHRTLNMLLGKGD